MNNFVTNNNRKNMGLCSILVGTLLIMFGCQNFFDDLNPNNSSATGYFSLEIDGLNAGRTIVPATIQDDFKKYTLEFFTAGTTAEPVVSETRTNSNMSDPVALNAGTYDLYVTAYMDEAGTLPAAEGELKGIVINAQDITSSGVALLPIVENGEGTFSWDIDWPGDVVSASMAITPLSTDGTPAQTLYFIGTTAVSKKDTKTFNTGYYRVIFKLSDSAGKIIEHWEILHIYQNMESPFEYEFKADEFSFNLPSVNMPAINGVTAPVTDAAPVTAITPTAQYSGTITWSPDHAAFEASTVYTATITLTAEGGFTLEGVAADFFTVAGAASVSNAADSGSITAVFPKTAGTVENPTIIDIAAILGVTPPETGAIPVTAITPTAQYTGTVSWNGNPSTFADSTHYTATITLTANAGYTLTGVTANFFTVAGTTTATNTANSGVITAVFPTTGSEEVVGSYNAYEWCAELGNITSHIAYQIVNLPVESRTVVMKVTNPANAGAAYYDLSAFKDQWIKIEFSADVKRVGTAGNLAWQINNVPDYPFVGERVTPAEPDEWYPMSGLWMGVPTNEYPSLYLDSYDDTNRNATYYIDNFTVTVTPITPIGGNLGQYGLNPDEDGNYTQARWILTEPNLTTAKTAGAQLVLTLNAAPTDMMQLVWQGPDNLLWWNSVDILDEDGEIESSALSNVTWDSSTNTLTIDLAVLADYGSFITQPSLNLIVAYYGGDSVNDLGMVRADIRAGGEPEPELTGTVSISVSAIVGQTLTADITALSGSGDIFYQWKRGATNIGSNSSTYIVQSADVGSTITVTVTCAGYFGSVTSNPTSTVTLPALTGTVSISGNAVVGAGLTAVTTALNGSGTISYQWKRGADVISTTSTYTVQSADVGSTITVTVTRAGYSGSVTSSPTAVVMLSVLPGTISISPTTAVTGMELTATYSGSETVSYQWNKGETAIDGKTGQTYTPTEAGSYTVTVSAAGYQSKTSVAVTVTLPALTGTVSISGSAVVGQTLTAVTTALNGSGTISYQWKRGETNVGANSTYQLVNADEGSSITVTVTRAGNSGDVTSSATAVVTFPALTGTVSINGKAEVGETLTADTTALGGSGAITYQWKRGDTDVVGTNSSTYQLVAADVDATITVTVTRAENTGSITSDSTAVVTLPALTGTVSISGNAIAGQTLTAETTALGGSGAITYQWKRGETNVGTNSTYQLVTDDIGSVITLTVTRSGNSGSVSSSTAIVTDPSLPALTGTVSISGNAIAGATLTAVTSALGGSGAITYQWKRGADVVGTNSSTYQLVDDDVGSSITLTVTCSGNSGSVTSDPVTVQKAQGFDITFDQFKDAAPEIDGPTISRSAAGSAAPITVENPGQYSSIEWRITGTTITGSGQSFSLNDFAAAYLPGKYNLTVDVMKDGVPYNTTVIVTITN